MPFAGIAGAVLGGIGDVAGSAYQSYENKKRSREQMAFQERMSSTAHQRQVADMRAAGINPALSGMGGSGASSAAGAALPASDLGGSLSRGIKAGGEAIQQYSANRMAKMDANIAAKKYDIIQTPGGQELLKLGVMNDLGLTSAAEKAAGVVILEHTNTNEKRNIPASWKNRKAIAEQNRREDYRRKTQKKGNQYSGGW